jgi:DNA-binding response OmpR family regulator
LRDALVEQLAWQGGIEAFAVETATQGDVAKPFRLAVLLARIRTQLRQYEASADAVFSFGLCTFRASSKQIINSEDYKIRLTDKENARHLYRAGWRPVLKEVPLQEVWGYNSAVSTHTLEMHIYRLRRKAEEYASNPSVLITEGGGYKLIA